MTDLLTLVQRRTFRPSRDNALLLVDDSLLTAPTWDSRLARAALLQLFARIADDRAGFEQAVRFFAAEANAARPLVGPVVAALWRKTDP